MLSLNVVYNDGSVITASPVTFLNTSNLPYISYEVDHVPDIQSVVIDDSVSSFSISYVNDSQVAFTFDSGSGGFDIEVIS